MVSVIDLYLGGVILESCDKCGAVSGQRCIRASGYTNSRPAPPHKVRLDKAKVKREAAEANE